jgi:hypothetical protein
MNERETERLLQDWLDDQHEVPAPATLRARILAIPAHDPRRSTAGIRLASPSWFIGHRRLVEIGLALTLLVLLAALIASASLIGSKPHLGLTATPNPSTSSDPDVSPIPAASAQILAPLGYLGKGTIAFVRTDPQANLDKTWLVDPAGSRESLLQVKAGWPSASGVTGFGCCPVFAPNGTQVAVGYEEINSFRGGGTWQTATVLWLDGAPASELPVICGGCASVVGLNYVPRAWSPDGTTVAIEGWSDANPALDGIELAPITQRADWSTQVTGAHQDVPVAFSPDGTRLLFVRIKPTDRSGNLFVLTMKTGAIGRQINPAGTLVFTDDYFGPAASWSPDGSQIAFAATDASGSPIQMSAYAASADGSHLRSLAGPTAYLTTAKWSPTGDWIAFDQAVTHGHDLFDIHPDGSGLTNLTAKSRAGFCCARWSPDGTALLAAGSVTADDESYLFIVPIDGSPIAQVTTIPALYRSYAWGPSSR